MTLDQVILHTVVHHSLTSTYVQNFIEIKGTFCGRTDGHLRTALLSILCRRVNLKSVKSNMGVVEKNKAVCFMDHGVK